MAADVFRYGSKRKAFSATDQIVINAICELAGGVGGVCEAKIADIAKVGMISSGTVGYSINRLIDLGLIEPLQRGGGRPNRLCVLARRPQFSSDDGGAV